MTEKERESRIREDAREPSDIGFLLRLINKARTERDKAVVQCRHNGVILTIIRKALRQ